MRPSGLERGLRASSREGRLDDGEIESRTWGLSAVETVEMGFVARGVVVSRIKFWWSSRRQWLQRRNRG